MVLITLIGEKLAVEGLEFTYVGANSECRSCKLKTVCFHLKPGRNYTITNIRDKKHTCNVHEGNAVIIEVNEQSILVSLLNLNSNLGLILIEIEETIKNIKNMLKR